MNNYHPPTPEEDVADLVAETRILFHRSKTALVRRINELEEASPPEEKATSTVMKDLRQALGVAMEESKHVEKFEKSLAAAVGSVGYDLDAARSEIGGRLARLRAARGDGGVSGQSE
jgi:hypothetical protein